MVPRHRVHRSMVARRIVCVITDQMCQTSPGGGGRFVGGLGVRPNARRMP
jgi:hypothetical protein